MMFNLKFWTENLENDFYASQRRRKVLIQLIKWYDKNY